MEENKKYSQRADILHKEDVPMEEATWQCPPVGEFVTHSLMRHSPANEYTGQEAHDRQEHLTRDKVKPVEQ